MIKRILGTATAMLLLIVGWPPTVSAHVLKVDGTIGAVLHINPDDNPQVGEGTNYVLSFTDSSGAFSLPACDCTVSFIADGKTLATKPLVVSSNTVSRNHYTFTSPAVYTIQVTGMPKTAGTFQPFTLDYQVRVNGGQTAMQPMPVLLWVGMGMVVGLVLLAAFATSYNDSEATQKKRNQ